MLVMRLLCDNILFFSGKVIKNHTIYSSWEWRYHTNLLNKVLHEIQQNSAVDQKIRLQKNN